MTVQEDTKIDDRTRDIVLPTHYLNINALCDYTLWSQKTGERMDMAALSQVLSPSMAAVELSTEQNIPIPDDVRAIYERFRPTPLWRARRFEEAIGTSCEIYVKNEALTPSGNHKANSAFFIASLCKRDGVRTLTTETTGNWGIALAIAAQELGLELVCFIDAESNRKRPDRKPEMERLGARVIVVEQDDYHHDLLALSADAAVRYTREIDGGVYIFGSIYGYFVVAQTIIGLEAREQLARLDRRPDIVVGSCGGGANLLGTASAFIADKLLEQREVAIVSAESEHCPIVSQGRRGLYSVDHLGYYPMLDTYGLPGLNDSEYIGGLGSTIVSSAVAELHGRGIVQPMTLSADRAGEAARLFHAAEGMWVALETGYQLAAVVSCARENKGKVIVVNVSAGAGDHRIYDAGTDEATV